MSSTRFHRAGLLIASLVFILVGVTGFVRPQLLVEPVDIVGASINAMNEFRGTYGGLHFGLGLFLLYSWMRMEQRLYGFMLMAVSTGFLFLGRIISLIFDGVPTAPMIAVTMSLEALGFFIALSALRRSKV